MRANYNRVSSKQKDIIHKEIDRQLLERRKELFHDIDTMILWTLHVELGFGKKRLERFYHAVIRNYREMCANFEMDTPYPAECKLKEIGVDLDELRSKGEHHEG